MPNSKSQKSSSKKNSQKTLQNFLIDKKEVENSEISKIESEESKFERILKFQEEKIKEIEDQIKLQKMTISDLNRTQVGKQDPLQPQLIKGQQLLNKFMKSSQDKQAQVLSQKETQQSQINEITKNKIDQLNKSSQQNSPKNQQHESQSAIKSEGSQSLIQKKTKFFTVKPCGKFFLHHKSLLNDPTLQPRKLEKDENIFDIIMPWVQEDLNFEKCMNIQEKNTIGLISNKEFESEIKNYPVKPKDNDDSEDLKHKKQFIQLKQNQNDGKKFYVQKTLIKEVEKPEVVLNPKALTQKQIYSKIITVKNVCDFDWKFSQDIWNESLQQMESQQVEIKDLEAIYMNPKWRKSKVGEFLTKDKEVKDPKADCDMNDANLNNQIDSKSNDQSKGFSQNNLQTQKNKNYDGLDIEDFKKLKIPIDVLKDGMVFIWVEKEFISDIIEYFEEQKLLYVENVCYIMIDRQMEEEVNSFQTIDATPAIIKDDYTYLKKSHKTLLMFRKQTSADNKQELRHQRTGDVVFDWKDPNNPQGKPDFYIYKLIETLLPKAMVDTKKYPHINSMLESFEKCPQDKHPKCNLKMVELWAQNNTERKGWIKVIEE